MTSLAGTWQGALRPSQWFGPILEKELRVASRRGPTYAVRSAYLLALAGLAAMDWTVWMRSGAANAVMTASLMGDLALTMVTTLVWYQLIMALTLAVVLPAGAIHEEIHRGSLGVLIVSGVSSLQIVLGKFVSRLLPVIMALVLSLPLLSVIRLWGGVPAEYVIAGFCVTLAAVLALASLSLLFSLSGASPHRVALAGAWILVLLYQAGYVWWAGRSLSGAGLSASLYEDLCLLSPFSVMTWQATALSAGGGPGAPWQAFCALAMALAACLLVLSTCLLRRAAVTLHPAGQGVLGGLVSILWPGRSRRASRGKRSGVRTVTGAAVLWKDHGGNVKGGLVRRSVWALALGTALVVLRLLARGNGTAENLCDLFMVGWWLVVSIHTATLAALSISQEREARSWSVLLTTPLSTLEIVRDKAASIALKTLFGWLVFLMYTVANQFVTNWIMAPKDFVPLLAMTILNAPVSMTFLIATGLYVGLRSRSAFAAMLVTMAVVFGFQFVRQEALIPWVSMLFPLRLGAWLGYHGLNLVFEVTAAAALLVLTVRSLRRYVF